jgi:adsorption protein B
MAGKYLGSLLVENGVLTQEQVNKVLARQPQTGLRFGELAVAMFNLRMTDVWRALAKQQEERIEETNLERESFQREALSTIPGRFAWAARVLPLRFEGHTLLIATTEGRLPDATAALCERLDHPVRFVLADEMQLKEFIMQRYPL